MEYLQEYCLYAFTTSDIGPQLSVEHLFLMQQEGRKEVFLFNDALNTFSYGYMESDI